MTMLEADSDRSEVLGDSFCYGKNFVEGCTSPCQGTGDFVNKNRASKATVGLELSVFWRGIGPVFVLTAFRQCFLGFGQRQRHHQR
jgi:hypothetical protein